MLRAYMLGMLIHQRYMGHSSEDLSVLRKVSNKKQLFPRHDETTMMRPKLKLVSSIRD
jgi:hypothetical protein